MVFEVLTQEPECVCCPCLKLCSSPPGTGFRVPRDIMSNCGGSGFDMFEIVETEGE